LRRFGRKKDEQNKGETGGALGADDRGHKNIDKGARWYLGDIAGAPLRRWDDRDQIFRSSYDVLRRPTHLHMKPGAAAELLLERMVYGDSAGTGIADPKVGNLRGKPIRHFDGAGRVKAQSYDFKGNSLTSDRKLAIAYTTTVDWSTLSAVTNLATLDSTAAALLETETFTETRAFDALNRITSLITPDTSELIPVYNEASLLNAVNVKVRGATPAKNFVANIDYDAKGQRTKIQYSDLGAGARFTTDYSYDKLTFRLTKLKTLRASPVNTLQELSYTFDPIGGIVQISDAAQQSLFYDDAFVAPDQLFVYDAIYRLVQGSGREHKSVGDVMVDQNDQPIRNLPLPSDPAAVRNYTETYTYDQIGNILQMFHSAGVASWTRNYTYTAGTNRLASSSGGAAYVHDFHGSMTSMPHLPTITYSPFDQMSSAVKPGAGTVYFTYDGGGQRVRKVWEETAFIKHERIYLGSYEIFRKRVSGVIDLERQTLHVNDGAQRIAMVETKTIATGGVPVATPVPMYRYQLGNHLGSAMLEIDETGLVISYEEYTPYGASAYQAARSGVDVSARRYRYTGKERDEETSLYYNGARYLAAWLGRWTSADPIGMQAGVNLYQYCRGSPIVRYDPDGLQDKNELRFPKADSQRSSAPSSEPLSEQLFIDKQVMRKTYDDAVREAASPEASTGMSALLYLAAAAVSPAMILEEVGRGALNSPSTVASGVEGWSKAATTEDPDDALSLGVESTVKIVTGLDTLISFLPTSFRPSGGQSSGSNVAHQAEEVVVSRPQRSGGGSVPSIRKTVEEELGESLGDSEVFLHGTTDDAAEKFVYDATRTLFTTVDRTVARIFAERSVAKAGKGEVGAVALILPRDAVQQLKATQQLQIKPIDDIPRALEWKFLPGAQQVIEAYGQFVKLPRGSL